MAPDRRGFRYLGRREFERGEFMTGSSRCVGPGTTVVSFRTGATRANNAMLGLSLAGLHNVWLSGTVTGGGNFHLLVDVNGYFAPSVPP